MILHAAVVVVVVVVFLVCSLLHFCIYHPLCLISLHILKVHDHHEQIRESNLHNKRKGSFKRGASSRSAATDNEEEEEIEAKQVEEVDEEEEKERMNIFTAVITNNIKELKEIVQREDQDIDERHPRSTQTPLMMAAKRGFNEALIVLLEAKVRC